MKYAVYVDNVLNDSIECLFYKTEEEAKTSIGNLIRECGGYSELSLIHI